MKYATSHNNLSNLEQFRKYPTDQYVDNQGIHIGFNVLESY